MNGKKSMTDIIKQTHKNMYERLETDPLFSEFQRYRKRAIMSEKLGNSEEARQYLNLAEQERKQIMPRLLEGLLQYIK